METYDISETVMRIETLLIDISDKSGYIMQSIWLIFGLLIACTIMIVLLEGLK